MGEKRMRFSIYDDLVLLRETVSLNPFENCLKWNDVQENLVITTNKRFSLRSTKDHALYLLKLYEKGDHQSLRKGSSCEEQYAEKKLLLQCMKELVEKHSKPKVRSINSDEPTSKRKDSKKRNEASKYDKQESSNDEPATFMVQAIPNIKIKREPEAYSNDDPAAPEINVNSNITENLELIFDCQSLLHDSANDSSSESFLEPRKKQKLNSSASTVEYLKSKQTFEMDFKKRRLDLEERKLQLEEQRIQLEEKRLQLERKKLELEERKFNLQEMEKKAELKRNKERDDEMKQNFEKQHLVMLKILEVMNKK
ncbi:hypothetical protein CDAR_190821 [Caerostris darwini]|uniref:Uncharacterized protein n=1 Tax=Caerostris darwini TaxID=1538125 RepID=A0AAV4VC23_9ARAC|nr:hypothetical protein CDAR_190821 [Caerostris darwini]